MKIVGKLLLMILVVFVFLFLFVVIGLFGMVRIECGFEEFNINVILSIVLLDDVGCDFLCLCVCIFNYFMSIDL